MQALRRLLDPRHFFSAAAIRGLAEPRFARFPAMNLRAELEVPK